MSETRLSPTALMIIAAFFFPLVIEARVGLSFVGIYIPLWWSIVAGIVAYGLILIWGTSPISDEGGEGGEPQQG